MANQEHLDILAKGVSVWNAWRLNRLESIPQLDSEDFRGAQLSRADFHIANFSKSDLRGSDLKGASLFGADLSYANLSQRPPTYEERVSGLHWSLWDFMLNTYLTAANLASANLGYANLAGADLTFVNLTDANLEGANLEGARVGGTTFANLDLRNVKGLQDIEHLAPSTIGLDTIYASKGQIPDVFLRGCGVDESFITYMRSFVDNPIEFYSCFISYSHQDKSFAHRLHAQLQVRGIRCWLDEHQMRPGDVIYDEIHRGIRLWDKVLLCCSEDALTSWWVDNEVATAFEKEQELGRQRGEKVLALIPLDLDGALFKQELTDGKSAQLRQRLAADFTGWENDNAKFESQFEKVVNALKTGDAGREPPPEPRL